MRTDWQRVRDIFERALEAQPAELEAWLAREAPDNTDIRAEVAARSPHPRRISRPWALAAFGLIGVASTIAGILRGHLLFVERMNSQALAAERGRTARITVLTDAAIAAGLVVDSMLLSTGRPAVLVAGLGAGIVLARLIVEPSTTSAAFDR
jgi:hypothetical protein